jgi:dTDP-4-dehydrorhamnose 3,5-epimerase
MSAPELRRTDLEGVVVVAPAVHRDDRGFFLESFHQAKYAAAGLDVTFVQDNHSASVGGVVRGLHLQLEKPQGKLVRVIEGEVFDVAVDLRRGSPTYRRWYGVNLSSENFLQLYVPPGFGHGFCVLSERAQVEYKCTALYDPSDELTVAWNDGDLGIDWPVVEPTLSARDRSAPPLRDVESRLPAYEAS